MMEDGRMGHPEIRGDVLQANRFGPPTRQLSLGGREDLPSGFLRRIPAAGPATPAGSRFFSRDA